MINSVSSAGEILCYHKISLLLTSLLQGFDEDFDSLLSEIFAGSEGEVRKQPK